MDETHNVTDVFRRDIGDGRLKGELFRFVFPFFHGGSVILALEAYRRDAHDVSRGATKTKH